MTRAQIIETARELIGTPWVHQGRMPGVGIDCAGVIVHILRANGIDYDVAGYAYAPDGTLTFHADACLKRITKDTYQPADVLVFRIKRLPQHVALVTDHGILHSYNRGAGTLSKVVETGLTDQWRGHIIAAYRFPWVSE
jgi:cell wall-associated NlpC family hydrolase